MKKVIILLAVIALSLIALFGCLDTSTTKINTSNNSSSSSTAYTSKITVTDYKTNESVLDFYLEEDNDTAILLSDITNYYDKVNSTPSAETDYVINIKDDGIDSYCNVFVDGNDLYIKWDNEKTNISNLPDADDFVGKCNKVTAKEFLEAIGR